MYNRNEDFEELCDRIDAHCITGDTLIDSNMRKLLKEYIGRWERQIQSWDEIEKQAREEML